MERENHVGNLEKKIEQIHLNYKSIKLRQVGVGSISVVAYRQSGYKFYLQHAFDHDKK